MDGFACIQYEWAILQRSLGVKSPSLVWWHRAAAVIRKQSGTYERVAGVRQMGEEGGENGYVVRRILNMLGALTMHGYFDHVFVDDP